MKRLSLQELNSGSEPALELDVAIVGGGVSGLYSGWRLLTAPNRPEKVHVFEMSDRIGGRLESIQLPGMHIPGELGGMRYTTQHEIVTALIEKVFAAQLTAVPFSMGDPATHYFYMRTQRFRANAWQQAQAEGSKFHSHYFLRPDLCGFSPDQLFNKIVYDVLLSDPWFVQNYAGKVSNPTRYDYRFQLTSEDWDSIKPRLTYGFPGPYHGMHVNDLGFWNVIKDQAGEEAFEYLGVAGGYYSNVANWNAAEAFPYMVGDFSNAATAYKTIAGGYDQTAYALADAFLHQPGSAIWSQNRLVDFEITSAGPRRYALTVFNGQSQKTWTVHADAIILAMPRRSLELLNQFNFFFDPETQLQRHRHMASVIMEPAFKLLMGFEEPWWKEHFGCTSGESVTDLPMRQCYYFGTDAHDSHSLFLASYNDMQSVPFWDVLESKDLEHWHPLPHKPHRIGTRTLEPQTWKKHSRWTPRATALAPQHEVDKFLDVQAPAAMVREAMAQVRELHGNPHIPDPYITHFKNWTEDPFGAGYHAWKAGVNVAEVMRYMRRPEPAEAIHICGEAYSDQQGWVEGALCVAERMLQEHFALAWPEWLNPKYYLGW